MDITSSWQAREYTLLNTRSVSGNSRNECIELRVECAEKGIDEWCRRCREKTLIMAS